VLKIINQSNLSSQLIARKFKTNFLAAAGLIHPPQNIGGPIKEVDV